VPSGSDLQAWPAAAAPGRSVIDELRSKMAEILERPKFQTPPARSER
jgi:hypothetical protein